VGEELLPRSGKGVRGTDCGRSEAGRSESPGVVADPKRGVSEHASSRWKDNTGPVSDQAQELRKSQGKVLGQSHR
jgi:hypothetical protein